MPGPSEEIPITVVMRSYNDAPLLPRTLAALDRQEGVRVTLSIFESASTDESASILEAHGYDRIHHLAPGTYQSSKVLNRGVAEAKTDLVAFLNSDAVMLHNRVLRLLAEAILDDDRRAGAFARQIPRPGAGALTRLDYHIAFGDGRRQLCSSAASWMTLVCSMIRKSAWQSVRFDEALTYAEDAVWSHQIQQAGWDTIYVPQAIVEHSHDYTWRQRYVRSYGDAAALARIADQPPAGILGGLLGPFAGRCIRDGIRLKRMGLLSHAWRLPGHRWPQILGHWRGSRDGWKHFRGSPVQGADSVSEGSSPGFQPLAAE